MYIFQKIIFLFLFNKNESTVIPNNQLFNPTEPYEVFDLVSNIDNNFINNDNNNSINNSNFNLEERISTIEDFNNNINNINNNKNNLNSISSIKIKKIILIVIFLISSLISVISSFTNYLIENTSNITNDFNVLDEYLPNPNVNVSIINDSVITNNCPIIPLIYNNNNNTFTDNCDIQIYTVNNSTTYNCPTEPYELIPFSFTTKDKCIINNQYNVTSPNITCGECFNTYEKQLFNVHKDCSYINIPIHCYECEAYNKNLFIPHSCLTDPLGFTSECPSYDPSKENISLYEDQCYNNQPIENITCGDCYNTSESRLQVSYECGGSNPIGWGPIFPYSVYCDDCLEYKYNIRTPEHCDSLSFTEECRSFNISKIDVVIPYCYSFNKKTISCNICDNWNTIPECRRHKEIQCSDCYNISQTYLPSQLPKECRNSIPCSVCDSSLHTSKINNLKCLQTTTTTCKDCLFSSQLPECLIIENISCDNYENWQNISKCIMQKPFNNSEENEKTTNLYGLVFNIFFQFIGTLNILKIKNNLIKITYSIIIFSSGILILIGLYSNIIPLKSISDNYLNTISSEILAYSNITGALANLFYYYI